MADDAQAAVDVTTLLAINDVIACARLVDRTVTIEELTLTRALLHSALERLDAIPPF
jgi:hypothetical protein